MSPWIAALLGAAVGFGLCLIGAGVLVARGNAREKARLEEHVREQLVRLVEAVGYAAMLVGVHDELLLVNDGARALGVARGTRVGFPELLTLVRERRRTHQTFSGPIRSSGARRRDEAELTVHVIPFANGTVLVLAQDESASRRVEAVRRDFVANVSHELKTPIGAIRILAEAIESASDDPESVAHFAARLENEAARLTELVSQIIDLSRLQSSDPMLKREIVDVDEIISEAINRTSEAALNRNVNLIVARSSAHRCFVMGDRWQLCDAVANLVQNAISYSDRDARVAVTYGVAEHNGDEFVDIKVADNGIGISLEDQERIFERFYRVDYGRSRENGGTGLGLSIVRHIALAHGGSVRVWSRPHQGSTFTFSLPLHRAAAVSEEEGSLT